MEIKVKEFKNYIILRIVDNDPSSLQGVLLPRKLRRYLLVLGDNSRTWWIPIRFKEVLYDYLYSELGYGAPTNQQVIDRIDKALQGTKPWLRAKPGEVWELGIGTDITTAETYRAIYNKFHTFYLFVDGDMFGREDQYSPYIISGRKLLDA